MNRRTFTLAALASLFLPSACKSKSLFAGLQIELSKRRIAELRERADNLRPQFDTAEVIYRFEGKEKRMSYEEFVARMEAE